MREGARRKTPVLLEIVRSGADLAAAEVEHRASLGGCVAHEAPIHQIVRTEPARSGDRPGIKGHDDTLVIKIQNAGDRFAVRENRQHVTVGFKGRQQVGKVALGEYRCSEITYADGIKIIEVVDVILDGPRQIRLNRLTHNGAL